MEETKVANTVVVNRRGRKKKLPDEVVLTEYKNVTDKEIIWLEAYGEEDKQAAISLHPGKTIFLSERDIRKYRNDCRFLEGRVVPVGSSQEIILTKEASDIMTDEQILYFIKNIEENEELIEKIDELASMNTIRRMLAISKEQDKSYSFVKILEDKLEKLIEWKKEHEVKVNG